MGLDDLVAFRPLAILGGGGHHNDLGLLTYNGRVQKLFGLCCPTTSKEWPSPAKCPDRGSRKR